MSRSRITVLPSNPILPQARSLTSTFVTLVLANALVQDSDGTYTGVQLPPLDYDPEEFRTTTGYLDNKRSTNGKTKLVFEVRLIINVLDNSP